MEPVDVSDNRDRPWKYLPGILTSPSGTRHLREQDIEIPIVALSAKVLNGDEHHQIADLFDGFLTKPVDSRKLSEMLQEFIDSFVAPDTSGQDAVVLEYGS